MIEGSRPGAPRDSWRRIVPRPAGNHAFAPVGMMIGRAGPAQGRRHLIPSATHTTVISGGLHTLPGGCRHSIPDTGLHLRGVPLPARQERSSRLHEKITVMPQDPVSHLRALIEKYTVISFIPDITGYRRITGPGSGTCIFRGCTEPIAWEDARGGNYLCEGHYVVMKRWIDEARQGLITGEHSAIFEPGTPRK